MKKTNEQIQQDLKEFLRDAYPEIEVRVEPFWVDTSRTAIFFIEQKFSFLYPQQRFHYLTHLIPAEYQAENLENSVWFELAPGEKPEELIYPDEELIILIKADVISCLRDTHFFDALDDRLCPSDDARPPDVCYGDYRVSKSILPTKGFSEDLYFDIFHVLMAEGGFCDCEILYNAAKGSRLTAIYWKGRAEGRTTRHSHESTWQTDSARGR